MVSNLWKIIILAGFIGWVGVWLQKGFEQETPFLEETWWGPEDKKQFDESIKPFKINVEESVLNDLKRRLKNTRPLTEPLQGVHHEYGMNTKLLNQVLSFWNEKYNWTERQAFLNQFPQYTTNIQGLNIHFLHVKPQLSSNTKIFPLLMLHGWTSSVSEFYEIIPKLTQINKNYNFTFELIIPSLPGFGFSQGATKPGLTAAHIAIIMKNLMKRLGFEQYYIQGTDWGSVISQYSAILFPDRVLGLHSNLCFSTLPWSLAKIILGSLWPSLIVDKEHETKLYPLSNLFEYYVLETGYFHIQATKPDTVGVALTDSPAGLAAYLLEKYIVLTNPALLHRGNGGLEEIYSFTRLVDNLMIYWISNTITSSMRLYAENCSAANRALGLEKFVVNVPTACSRYSHDVIFHPDSILKDKFKKLVYTSDNEGGHYPALENPSLLSEEIFKGFDHISRF